jgi:crotonobetainyl-CoA:carnitine CoA-transferase CaiB-like acyl-CoA transferase
MTQFLDGLRVLDFGSGLSGRLVTMMLRDYGAEVLVVERPGGDPLRGHRAYQQWQRGKSNTILDLKCPEDVARARALAVEADVLVHDWRPGVDRRFGLDAATLETTAPSLIHCTISGFGSRGPSSHVKAYEAIVLAKAGFFWGAEALTERDGPTFLSGYYGSFAAAHAAVQGILAALHVRTRTGRGQSVETSLTQALTPYDLYGWLTVETGLGGMPPGTVGHVGMLTACTRDGRWIQFANAQRAQREAFVRALDLMDEYVEVDQAGGSFEPFVEQVRERIRAKDLAEWMEIFLSDDDIGFEPHRTAIEALDHPQLIAAGQVVEFDHPELGPMRQLGPIAVFDDADPSTVAAAAPSRDSRVAQFASIDSPRPFMPGSGSSILGSSSGTSEGVETNRGPLDGVTVLELGWYYAAPFGTTLLAELGARVIKVESLVGDPHRWQFAPPEYCGIKVLSGKESIAVDVNSPHGREILRRLVRRSDVVMRSFREANSRRMGVDFESMRKENPTLAYVYAGAYGATGPYCARPAYAPTMSSGAGVNSRMLGLGRMLTADGNPLGSDGQEAGGRLAAAGFPAGIGDSAAAFGVGTGLMLALLAAERRGHAVNVQTTMLGTNAFFVSDEFIDYAGAPEIDRPGPDLLGTSALYRLYRAGDGEWIFLAAPQEAEWGLLCDVLGEEESGASMASPIVGIGQDARFATPAARRVNDADLAARLEHQFGRRPAAEWESRLTAADVACAVVSRTPFSEFTMRDPIMVENGWVAESAYPGFGGFHRHGSIVSLSHTPTRTGRAPRVGQQTRSILAQLGYSEAEIEALHRDEVVGSPDSNAVEDRTTPN